MTEWTQGWLASIAWLVTTGFITLYWIGGTAGSPGKWVRRIAGGELIAISTILLSLVNHTYHWFYWLGCLFLPISLSLGYSATHGKAWLKRLIYGLAVSANSLIYAIPIGLSAISIAIYQIFLGISASIFFGLTNPFKNRPKEEAVIGGLSVILIPMIV